MPIYQFIREQYLNASPVEVWDFISVPENLSKITPDYMGFKILSKNLPIKIYAGMIISYRVKPVAGIPVNWVTEITQVADGKFFIDEQRIGPYSFWHHQHLLEEKDGGVLMTDIVSYKPPFSLLGALANSLFIRKKLEEIFLYREKILNRRFPLLNHKSTFREGPF